MHAHDTDLVSTLPWAALVPHLQPAHCTPRRMYWFFPIRVIIAKNISVTKLG
jgi:hypothetical protein